jgi:hypothetical protein
VGAILILFLASCTESKPPLPSKEKYFSDTDLMIKICSKFYQETDASKLHKVAVATQSSRVISCENYFGECNLYGDFLALAISVSKDNELSAEDRNELRLELDKLKLAIQNGRKNF